MKGDAEINSCDMYISRKRLTYLSSSFEKVAGGATCTSQYLVMSFSIFSFCSADLESFPYPACVTPISRTPCLLPSLRYWRNSMLTLTYSRRPSLTLIVAPVVQDSSKGSIKGASVMEGCEVFRLVMNQVEPHLFNTSIAMSLTVSKCGLP
ncbi:hypothetical protein AC579_3126 [Pseudocercospora musae]|uniref:Uncharacterized protein n=1 Tax=Pseudocercospora musae TaxID=113226 RepID=A0A139IAH6_9PEZI|nr:hypothetical protein AC579_3126 [Pseudocercospora musae]